MKINLKVLFTFLLEHGWLGRRGTSTDGLLMVNNLFTVIVLQKLYDWFKQYFFLKMGEHRGGFCKRVELPQGEYVTDGATLSSYNLSLLMLLNNLVADLHWDEELLHGHVVHVSKVLHNQMFAVLPVI